MIPSFDPEGGAALVLLRGSADAGLLSAFGSLLALAWFAPPLLPLLGVAAPLARQRLRRLAAMSIIAAIVLSACWLLAESADMAGSATEAPAVLRQTWFGHLVAARTLLLLIAGSLLMSRHTSSATVIAAIALASQAGHDHAWAMAGGFSLLLLSNVAHLLAAGAWLGGLVPLLVLVAVVPPEAAAQAARRFAMLGTPCVVLIAGTALFQASIMVASWSALFHQPYGWVACAKIALFLALVSLAAWNRFRLTPALQGSSTKAALCRSIAIETAAGLLVVLAAALLTSLQPGMDM